MKTGELLEIYNKYKLIIFPLLVGVVAIILSYTVIYPQINKYVQGQEETKLAEEKVKKLENKVKVLETLQENELTSKLDKAITALPIEKDLAALVGFIRKLTTENSISLTALALNNTGVNQGSANAFSLRMEVSGSTAAIRNFMNSLEKAPRVMKVATIEVTPSRSSASASSILTIEVFFSPAPTALGSVDADLPTLTDKDEEILNSIQLPQPEESGPSGTTAVVVRGKPDPFK